MSFCYFGLKTKQQSLTVPHDETFATIQPIFLPSYTRLSKNTTQIICVAWKVVSVFRRIDKHSIYSINQVPFQFKNSKMKLVDNCLNWFSKLFKNATDLLSDDLKLIIDIMVDL